MGEKRKFRTVKARSDDSEELCWRSLALAIVLQAADDYRKALCRLKKNPTNKSNICRAVDLEKFFHSAWYGMLCAVDGDSMIDELQKEVYK